jgi:hypothetical protein
LTFGGPGADLSESPSRNSSAVALSLKIVGELHRT